MLYVNLAAYYPLCVTAYIALFHSILHELVWLHLLGRETTGPQHHDKVRALAGEEVKSIRCVFYMQSANKQAEVIRVPFSACIVHRTPGVHWFAWSD